MIYTLADFIDARLMFRAEFAEFGASTATLAPNAILNTFCCFVLLVELAN
jgi:hypothetical protein